MLSVPYFKQDTNFTCGPASVQMVLAFYKQRISESALTTLMSANPDSGSTHEALINIFVERGLHCYVNRESSLEELEYLLSLSIPPIVHWIEPEGEEDHYSVVVAISAHGIFLHDPWTGPEYKLTKNDFTARWHCDSIGEGNRWVLAASVEPLPLGHQYHPL